jgi:hypothetical protein
VAGHRKRPADGGGTPEVPGHRKRLAAGIGRPASVARQRRRTADDRDRSTVVAGHCAQLIDGTGRSLCTTTRWGSPTAAGGRSTEAVGRRTQAVAARRRSPSTLHGCSPELSATLPGRSSELNSGRARVRPWNRSATVHRSARGTSRPPPSDRPAAPIDRRVRVNLPNQSAAVRGPANDAARPAVGSRSTTLAGHHARPVR